MGLVYRLKPEVRNFTIEQKKANPELSCRALISLVEKRFQVKISKSSINAVIKQAGLSMPVGRRSTKPKPQLEPKLFLGQIKTAITAAAESLQLLRAPEEKPQEIVAQPEPGKPGEAPVEKPAELPVVEEPVGAPVEAAPEIKAQIPQEAICSGVIILKAADYIIGGSALITEAIKKLLNKSNNDLRAKTESLIYLSLLTKENLPNLWPLIGRSFSLDIISAYLSELQSVEKMSNLLIDVIAPMLSEVRAVKINLLDGSNFYLDGQLHTIWSTQSIPYDFNATIYNINGYINKYFLENKPFILFTAPGYDTPSKEFINFIASRDSVVNKFSEVIFYGNKLEELGRIPLNQTKKGLFVFGLWPWQYTSCRKVNKIGEFKPAHFPIQGKDLYLAEIEMDISQLSVYKSLTLRGCAIKTGPAEKIRLVILSNFSQGQIPLEELADIYLSRWPNLEEAFQDYSRKIELFTYTAASQRYFSSEKLNLGAPQDVKSVFDKYLQALDLYVKWHLLPSGWEEKDLSTIKDNFYDLGVLLKKENTHIKAIFRLPREYRFSQELEYLCRRLNEREIISSDGKRLWFLV